MRWSLVASSLALALAASPLAGQAQPIAPAASVLFRNAPPSATVQDTLAVDDGMPQGQGAFLGMLVGAGMGYLAVRLTEHGPNDCVLAEQGCGEPIGPKRKVMGAVVGGIAGLLVGGAWAGPHPVARTDRGLPWWGGAMLGGVIGVVASAYVVDKFENEPGVNGSTFIPLSALVGAVVGGRIAYAH